MIRVLLLIDLLLLAILPYFDTNDPSEMTSESTKETCSKELPAGEDEQPNQKEDIKDDTHGSDNVSNNESNTVEDSGNQATTEPATTKKPQEKSSGKPPSEASSKGKTDKGGATAADKGSKTDKGGATAADKGSKKKGSKKPVVTFPNTLEGFGYQFVNGELRNIKTNERFVFVVKPDDKEYNQMHYEALGETITEEVYKLLETTGNLSRITIPSPSRGKSLLKSKEADLFFFASADVCTSEKLMILIHGNGVVRAGQWARRLIINDNLDSGTQLPFIKAATELGYGVIVLNTNRDEVEVDGKTMKVYGSKTPEKHAVTVWNDFIKDKTIARTIHIVAHSFGGVVTLELLKACPDFTKRVEKIAFTDSVHVIGGLTGSQRRFITGHAINWVTSPNPFNTPVDGPRSDVLRRSAGTLKHEETSYNSFQYIFEYFTSDSKIEV